MKSKTVEVQSRLDSVTECIKGLVLKGKIPAAHRLLDVGEKLRKSDQFWCDGIGPWKRFDDPSRSTIFTGGSCVRSSAWPVIRKIEGPRKTKLLVNEPNWTSVQKQINGIRNKPRQ
jgi:hypothetical protein